VKVLLTGATGFLGKALLRRLTERGEVVALHRPGTNPPEFERVRWVAQDLASPLSAELPDRIDAVLHIAQSRRYREFPDGAVDVMEVNAMATTRLLDYCRRSGGSVFVYASSGAVNAPGDQPVTEADIPAPANLYAISKHTGEQIVEQFRPLMRAHSLRYFFIYGPGQRGMMMPGIIDRIASGLEVQLAGEHGIRLNPIYVEDAADATVAALDLPESATVNIAGPEAITIRRIADIAAAALGTESRFAYGAPQPDLVASTERMNALLVAPTTTPVDGLRSMIAER
jgi:nucleoside-diphosphate-sugar epimerase